PRVDVRARGVRPPKAGAPGVSAAREDRRVLIVDDDRQIRRVLSEFFTGSQYDCHEAANGAEGLKRFADERPPLTVTDVDMPEMNGLEFIRHARALDPDAAFLVLTGVGDIQTAVESLKFGAYDFILKPVNMDVLLIAADRALEHRELLIERREYHTLLERRRAGADAGPRDHHG